MKNIILFDEDHTRKNLLPLTFTRPVCEIRFGIFTIREKWESILNTTVSYLTQDYLSEKYPLKQSADNIFINGKVCPDKNLVTALKDLKEGESLFKNQTLIAYCGPNFEDVSQSTSPRISYKYKVLEINHTWDIFQKNSEALKIDFEWIVQNKKSIALSSTVTVIGDRDLVFLDEGAVAEACILNTMSGPIYIGKDAEIMEGSAVRGPFSLGEHSALKLNTKIYGATTIGPHCKVGGEVNNSVIFGFTNKAHDGFLGNSVIGEWCNIGADSNNSNLKNNYGNVKLFSYAENKQIDTGLQFCGLIMGDHSKCGINTMFNTGTVVGTCSNIYGGGFPPTHIRSFSWGGSEGFVTYKLEKLFETAEKVFERRGLVFNEAEQRILKAVFSQTT